MIQRPRIRIQPRRFDTNRIINITYTLGHPLRKPRLSSGQIEPYNETLMRYCLLILTCLIPVGFASGMGCCQRASAEISTVSSVQPETNAGLATVSQILLSSPTGPGSDSSCPCCPAGTSEGNCATCVRCVTGPLIYITSPTTAWMYVYPIANVDRTTVDRDSTRHLTPDTRPPISSPY